MATLLITGASGFLGRYVVAAALRSGYQVRALTRSTSSVAALAWSTHPAVEVRAIDLTQPAGLEEAVRGVDAVIHLAAAKGGDSATQYRCTVTATENLLAAMTAEKVRRLVAISTFSVYDYLGMPPGATLTEDSPIESRPQYRDGYAQTKLIQEQRFREFAQQGGQVTILRPGIVYGHDNLWHASLGLRKGDRLWVRIGDEATLPLVYVENCATAIVQAVDCEAAIGQTLNLVDDNLPTQQVYASKLLARMSPQPRVVSVGWSTIQLLSSAAWAVNRLLAGKVKLPGLFVPARVHARFKPLRYTNQRAKQILGWQPPYSLDQALDCSLRSQEPLEVPVQPNSTSSV